MNLSENERIAVFNSLGESGRAAVKSAFFLNGGASAALLAYSGQGQNVLIPLLCFGLGALLVTIASGMAYLQNLYIAVNWSEGKEGKDIFNYVSIGLVIASYFLSLFGLMFFGLCKSAFPFVKSLSIYGVFCI